MLTNVQSKRPLTRGQRIRKIRGEMSQTDFAEALGVSRTAVSHWEADRHSPSASHLKAMAELFDLNGQTVGELVLCGTPTEDADHMSTKRQGVSP